MLKIIIPFLLFISNTLLASNLPRVDADLKIYDDQIVALSFEFEKVPANPQDKEWVKFKINHMFEVDQYMRHYWDITSIHQYTDAEKQEFKTQFLLRAQAVDSANTYDLKKLLKIYRWFKISEFGAEIDKKAWLLVQHADLDPSFQKEVLIILTDLYKAGETNPSNYAYLWIEFQLLGPIRVEERCSDTELKVFVSALKYGNHCQLKIQITWMKDVKPSPWD